VAYNFDGIKENKTATILLLNNIDLFRCFALVDGLRSLTTLKEKFDDTKGVIISRKS
jgi:hypothetical protein